MKSIRDLISIYIPTYKRWDKMSTHKLVPYCTVVCPIEQVEKYKEHNEGIEILACPNEVEGNIAKKRNWIKRQCKTPYLIMLDDDITHFQRLEGMVQQKLSHDEVMKMFLQGFQLMEDLGTVLWGINLTNAPQGYRENLPFSMLSPVLGPFSAQKNINTLWYDERLPLKEDYDLSLQVLQKYHKILRMNKYSYVTKHLTNADGGCVSYRTIDRELAQNKQLQKKWGKEIVKFDMSRSVNPLIKVKLKGM